MPAKKQHAICIRYTCCQIEIILPSSNAKRPHSSVFPFLRLIRRTISLRMFGCGAAECARFSAQCKQKILLNSRPCFFSLGIPFPIFEVISEARRVFEYAHTRNIYLICLSIFSGNLCIFFLILLFLFIS